MASRRAMIERIPVYLEVAPRRTFAMALDWPGWGRAGRDEATALEALFAYAPRYAAAIADGDFAFAPPANQSALQIVERLPGGPTTEFGAPDAIPSGDHRQLASADLERQRRLLEAAWRAFDRTAAEAADRELRKGPRGGGRDLPQVIEHVAGAEYFYLRRFGVRDFVTRGTDPSTAWNALRASIIEALTARVENRPADRANAARARWPPRYFVRRAAWHVLDHAWEIEDRAQPDATTIRV